MMNLNSPTVTPLEEVFPELKPQELPKRLTPEFTPAGVRALIRRTNFGREPICEITVEEWSPGGLVKLRFLSGLVEWFEPDVIPWIVEILPNAN